MISFVNAKINLGLNIVGKRADGYHELETVFYPVGVYNGTPQNPEPFCDILEIHPCESIHKDEFTFSGNPIECPPEKNLVYKAVKAFRAATANKNIPVCNVKVFLNKHIPDGAGLGGGSADASFALRLLNNLFNNALSKKDLIKIAHSLGADCPFFIENRPVIAHGIGEIMQPVDLNLSGYWAIIVKPKIHISTKEAFSGVKLSLPEKPIEEIISLPIEEWDNAGLKNDFESHIFVIYPRLRDIKQHLLDSGAIYAAMSGSGSSIFGLFPGGNSTHEIFREFKNHLYGDCPCFLCKL